MTVITNNRYLQKDKRNLFRTKTFMFYKRLSLISYSLLCVFKWVQIIIYALEKWSLQFNRWRAGLSVASINVNYGMVSLFIDFNHFETDSLIWGALFFRCEDHDLIAWNAEALLFGNSQDESNESIAVHLQMDGHLVANYTTTWIDLMHDIGQSRACQNSLHRSLSG